ncbi:MAG: 50S ribosomal protein L32 [Anaerolineae bacterium]
MAGVPKSKVSKGRRGRRRAHDALKLATLVECPQCQAKRLPHHVCPSCGYYRGVQVVEVS